MLDGGDKTFPNLSRASNAWIPQQAKHTLVITE